MDECPSRKIVDSIFSFDLFFWMDVHPEKTDDSFFSFDLFFWMDVHPEKQMIVFFLKTYFYGWMSIQKNS